jgi:aminoglycoside phosphotransferase family enzyme
MRRSGETCELEQKLAHLRLPGSYPDVPKRVEVKETHFAWIFLSTRFVYKLKKPIRFHDIDFTSLEKRKKNCEAEVVLNRRLTEDVYLGVVPLCCGSPGLQLEGDSEIVEWLVKMRRLPAERMLDVAAIAGDIELPALDSLLAKLAEFYRTAGKAPWSGRQYADTLAEQSRRYATLIGSVSDGIKQDDVTALSERQFRFIARNRPRLERRIEAGRVVDAHGDLRPEHICLGTNPQIIDCLEFSDELRLLDTAEELSFLDLECQRLGCGDLGRSIRRLYERHCLDPIESDLYLFYRSRRALSQAFVCARRLQDDLTPALAARWTQRANWYLRTALENLRAATGQQDDPVADPGASE